MGQQRLTRDTARREATRTGARAAGETRDPDDDDDGEFSEDDEDDADGNRTGTNETARAPRANPENHVTRRVSGRPLILRYCNASGYRTERNILPSNIVYTLVNGRPAYGRISAYCVTRQAVRTFRIDRIEWVADGETGEVIPDVERHLLPKGLNG